MSAAWVVVVVMDDSFVPFSAETFLVMGSEVGTDVTWSSIVDTVTWVVPLKLVVLVSVDAVAETLSAVVVGEVS